jgi:Ca2+-binding RTX toxin-like protein
MRLGNAVRLAALGAAAGLVLISAFAATNAVPASNAERDVSTVAVDQLKPQPQCNGVTPVELVTGGANGGNASELVLGTAGADNPLRGQNGNDCIVGGGGNDLLRGDGGADVCVGGPGADTFHTTCETQIQ